MKAVEGPYKIWCEPWRTKKRAHYYKLFVPRDEKCMYLFVAAPVVRQFSRRWTMHEGTLSDALRELECATKEHEEAQRVTGEARSRETAAVTRLNAAQKRVDELVARMKKGAPPDSDWGRVGRNYVPVTQ